MSEPQAVHKTLNCGIELVAQPLPGRGTVSGELRFLSGFVNEAEDKLGINHIVEQTITKGTQRYDGRALSDEFDAIGTRWNSYAGRESTGFQFTCLPEFVDRSLELHAEFLRRPTFPAAAIKVSVENTLQDISTIGDDPEELSAKLFNRQVYGPVLGRHVLGEEPTVRTISQEDVQRHYRTWFHAGRIQASFAGALDVPKLEAQLDQLFDGFGSRQPAGREPIPHVFEPMTRHHDKELEQEHIGICYPGAPLSDERRYPQRVVMGVLSGGMSARLFTEVRELQGLAYSVVAWTEHPRGVGIVYLGASTTPDRCERTFKTLLREVDRLREDLTAEEVQRASAGIVAKSLTGGDITRARRSELGSDLFHHGRVIPREQKMARIQAVTVDEVKAYLHDFPRRHLSVFTLGPRELVAETT